MRKQATIKNSFAGLLNKIVSIIFVFVVRHYFAKYLNVEYLGLEGLFSNILGLFALVDLGLGNAISFNLYGPIHNNDRELISSIMHLYKVFFAIIGAVIFGLSLLFSPFLLRFIKDYSIDGREIVVYFLIYAFSVSITYLFSYKRTILFALQRNYLVLNIDTITKIVLSIMQMVSIIVVHNYLYYLLATIIVNLMGNIVISIVADKEDVYDKFDIKPLSKAFKEKLIEHVKALAVTNFAWQGIVSTDNILISSIIGVVDLAKNANYTVITNSINHIITAVLGGASASIGDLIVENDSNKSKLYFDRYNFIYFVISSYAGLGMYFVSKPVITLWVGETLSFDKVTTLIVSINLFLSLVFKPIADYQNYSGNFVYYKPYSIVAVIINLVSSIVLGNALGIMGIFIGTTITYMFMLIVVVQIQYNHIFIMNSIDYYIRALQYSIPMIISFAVLTILLKHLPDSIALQVLISFMETTLIFGLVLCVTLWGNSEFKYFFALTKKILSNRSLQNL